MTLFGKYSFDQLTGIVETLGDEAMLQNSEVAKTKLAAFQASWQRELKSSTDFAYNQLLRKVEMILACVNGDFNTVKNMIVFGTFSKDNHPYLRKVFKFADDAQNPDRLPSHITQYPSSIDPKDEDGVSETIAEHLENYYVLRRQGKKALNIAKVSESTGIKPNVLKKRFELLREGYSGAFNKSRKEAPMKVQKTSEKEVASPVDFEKYQAALDFFALMPSPPLTQHDLFPTYRIPIDQPLFVLIP